MMRLPRHPAAWFLALLLWFAVLWSLSSVPGRDGIAPIPHFDKFLHFSYFFIGGFLCSGGHFRLHGTVTMAWRPVVGTAVLVMAAIGWMDEWHQCYTPGRSGGDLWDWLADVSGGASGALVLMWVHHRLR
jgi:VanZ family protein